MFNGLPFEIISIIAKNIDNSTDLRNFALVCNSCKESVKEVYDKIEIKINNWEKYKPKILHYHELFHGLRVHYVEIYDISFPKEDLYLFKDAHTIATTSNHIQGDLSDIENIKELTIDIHLDNELIHDMEILDYTRNQFNRIESISGLKKIERLFLPQSLLSIGLKGDFSNLRELDIQYTGVSDVSMFGNLEYLNISYCGNIRDFSALTNVKHLVMCGTTISDVEPLKNTLWLDMSNCYGVKDVSPLKNAHTLILRNCLGISDVSCFKESNLQLLDLMFCDNIEDISMLENKIPELEYISKIDRLMEL